MTASGCGVTATGVEKLRPPSVEKETRSWRLSTRASQSRPLESSAAPAESGDAVARRSSQARWRRAAASSAAGAWPACCCASAPIVDDASASAAMRRTEQRTKLLPRENEVPAKADPRKQVTQSCRNQSSQG
jgi:hypothetical protein